MAKSYYTILGITSRASQADVKAAYRRLAKELHPDRYTGTDRPFLDVQEAYSVLGDAASRREYDAKLSRMKPPPVRRARTCEPEPLIDPGWSAFEPERVRCTVRPRPPEPLVPERNSTDLGRPPRVRTFRVAAPLFDEIFDWLWDNFADVPRSNAETLR